MTLLHAVSYTSNLFCISNSSSQCNVLEKISKQYLPYIQQLLPHMQFNSNSNNNNNITNAKLNPTNLNLVNNNHLTTNHVFFFFLPNAIF